MVFNGTLVPEFRAVPRKVQSATRFKSSAGPSPLRSCPVFIWSDTVMEDSFYHSFSVASAVELHGGL